MYAVNSCINEVTSQVVPYLASIEEFNKNLLLMDGVGSESKKRHEENGQVHGSTWIFWKKDK